MDKLELKHLAPYLPYELRLTACSQPMNGRMCELLAKHNYSTIKPILRPLSDLEDNLDWLSQMEEDVNHFLSFHNGMFSDAMAGEFTIEWIPQVCFEWLIKNHFDVFGLIPAGLAISYKEAGL